MQDLEAKLMSLMKGEFSSLKIEYNDGCGYYRKAADEIAENPEYYSDDSFVSLEDKQKCIDENSLWTIHWYPNTPVGFCHMHGSSLALILQHVFDEEGL